MCFRFLSLGYLTAIDPFSYVYSCVSHGSKFIINLFLANNTSDLSIGCLSLNGFSWLSTPSIAPCLIGFLYLLKILLRDWIQIVHYISTRCIISSSHCSMIWDYSEAMWTCTSSPCFSITNSIIDITTSLLRGWFLETISNSLIHLGFIMP